MVTENITDPTLRTVVSEPVNGQSNYFNINTVKELRGIAAKYAITQCFSDIDRHAKG